MIPVGARVYVIDDDASFVRSALRLLASWGIPAEGFTSALRFLEREWTANPACALVDLRMPGVSGLDLQEALLAAGDALPVILMSGHTDAQSRDDAFASGAVDFVTKPVSEERLLEALDRAFAGHDGARPRALARYADQECASRPAAAAGLAP